MSDNWIITNLENALSTWNDKLSEVWLLITETPQNFKGGAIWTTIVDINGALQAIGYGLLVLFFAMGIFRSTASFKDFQRPEYALKHFIRFVLAKTAITYALDIMTGIFSICGGVVNTIGSSMGGMTQVAATLPTEITTAIEDIGFFASIPLWLVTLLGSLFIFVLSIILILTVYGRFFKLYLYTALAPVPLASFAGEGTNSIGKAFVKSYTGVCMEGAVIILACIIFTAFASTSAPVIDTATSTVTMVWKYIGEIIFNMLVLVGLVKASDRIVREMLGL